MGTPSVFVRVSGCNLRCVWCDTPYASWSPEGPTMPVSEIVEKVIGLDCQHVVLTGGEPMLFEPIVWLASELKERGHTITIETAGTVYRDLPCDLMSISPKLSNSIPPDSEWHDRHDSNRLNFEVLTRLVENYNCQLKFVIADQKQDVQEIEAILARLPKMSPDKVLIMPEGTDAERLKLSLSALVPLAMQTGWRLCPRLHIELFGNTKGT